MIKLYTFFDLVTSFDVIFAYLHNLLINNTIWEWLDRRQEENGPSGLMLLRYIDR